MSQTLICQTEKEIISSILEIILIHSSLDFEKCKRIEKMWKASFTQKMKSVLSRVCALLRPALF